MLTNRLLVLMTGLAACSTTAFANDVLGYRTVPSESGIHKLLERQHTDLTHAIRHGLMRPKDARKLRHEHEKLVRMENRLAGDGWTSRHERRNLAHKIHELDDRILRKQQKRRYWTPAKHNRWHSPGSYHRFDRCDIPRFRVYSPYQSSSFYRRISFSW